MLLLETAGLMLHCTAHYPDMRMNNGLRVGHATAGPLISRRWADRVAVPLGGCAGAPADTGDARSAALCGEVPGIARELTEISGFELRRPVPCDFISKEKVNEFLKKKRSEERRVGK